MDNLIESFRGYLQVLADANLPRKLKSKIDAADLVQTTIMKALLCQDELRDLRPIVVKSWLRTILANTITDAYKHFYSAKRNVDHELNIHAQLDESNAGLENWLIAENTSPSRAAIRDEEFSNLLDAIAQLPDSMRDVVIKKHIRKMTLKSIAEETGTTVPAVAGLLRRALAKLRDSAES